MTLRIAFFSCLVALLAACGGSTPGSSADPVPFSPELELLFDNGVDFVANPEAYEGDWMSTWLKELEDRTREADAVAILHVTTVRTDVNPKGERSYWIVGKPTKVLKGQVVERELSLRAGPGDPGYTTVGANESRMLRQDFIVFLKWRAATASSADALRWHGSLSHDALIKRVNDALHH